MSIPPTAIVAGGCHGAGRELARALAAREFATVVNRQAARRLHPSGAIVAVSSAEPLPPDVAEELRARDITINGVAPGLEPPGAAHTVTQLVAPLDQWRDETRTNQRRSA